MEDITLTINGKNISCPSGTSILEAAKQNGIKIPTLCYHPDLEPFGACRLCLVEDEKTGRLVASCVTPVASNMTIRTDSPTIIKHRTNIVRLMMANHPESCIVCSQGNRCELRQIAAELGVGEIDLYPMPHYTGLEAANPFIVRDLSKCILCGKCVRADHELVVAGAIDYNLRGFKSRPATLYDMPLERSVCTFCGTCLSLCPTGALSLKNEQYVGSPQDESQTVCGFCGVGCSIVMGSVDGRIVEVNPSHEQETVNGSTLCVRGHFAHDFLNAKDRLTQPMVRDNGELVPVSWDAALDTVSKRLVDIKKKYGPQSVAFLGSSKCTNEENYLFQKIARVLFETNNVDNGGYISGRAVLNLIEKRMAGACRKTPLRNIEKAEAIVLLGADPGHSVPVVSYYVKRASRKGTPLIVVDPRKTEMVPFSSLWLPLVPHTDSQLINGLAAMLWKREARDASFIERFTEGFDSYCEGIKSLDIETVCRDTGLTMGVMEQAADLLAGKKIAFVCGNGILKQKYGMPSMDALLNLLLMTGSLGSERGGLYIPARENNQVGAWDMGAVPDALPGRRDLGGEPARKAWERAWQAKISPDRGLDVIRMVEEAEKGSLKALYIMGENPLRSLPQTERVRKSLERLDFLVVQDILLSETCKIANVALPGAAFCEKAGSFTNMEGRIQSFGPVTPPPGEAKADWRILDFLAVKMGYPKPYGSLDRIRAEIAQFIPMYEDLDGHGDFGWIKETGESRPFQPGGEGEMISFTPVISIEHEADSGEYPFTAILGSQRFHLGSGTRTGRSGRIRDHDVKGEIELDPEDGASLNLQDGDTVRVESEHGFIEREIRLENGLKGGLIFIPTAFNSNDAMNLIGLTRLGESDSPGWQECQVKITKL
ncbi:MAG: molybdopterin-dependent oxidoreductase [Deltaproteobacteria bacterium]|nr:molybdopterin-dependent oxidoreductase [Deltaproteobacteria bacterium]MBW2344809.1 molybdopterin-dependent oxidoreductase [Deltaproteobacteria bacterium]